GARPSWRTGRWPRDSTPCSPPFRSAGLRRLLCEKTYRPTDVTGAIMATGDPILVTGAAGSLGGVGRTVVELLRQRNLPVRALVRREDERAQALRAIGAEVVVGDLTRAGDIAHALAGCRRMYFGMSVSAPYLEATVSAAAVAPERSGLEGFVNISQMTVSQMS